MKKLSIYLSILLLFACNKRSTEFSPEFSKANDVGTISETIFDNVSRLSSSEDRLLAYSTLSNEDRYRYWLSKMSKIVANLESGSERRKALVVFKDNLSVDLFRESDQKQIFMTHWLPKWIENSKSLFSVEEINEYVFTSEYFEESHTSASLTTTGTESARCSCAIGSSYTCLGLDPIPPHAPKFGTCIGAETCITLSRGCGALGDDSCTGNGCIGIM
ncbi:bacteriocin fulvocin C-related protein [Pedobacter ghigonis]|uniref:bacteriocin fulvocin C-related protein n=1 Tax=Pedobacter ghigonis TaxID=2730403 RepID=UPI00158D3767|nr:bacteriocin fulvocin C-related protein [Pedobacter ghigonis]